MWGEWINLEFSQGRKSFGVGPSHSTHPVSRLVPRSTCTYFDESVAEFTRTKVNTRLSTLCRLTYKSYGLVYHKIKMYDVENYLILQN